MDSQRLGNVVASMGAPINETHDKQEQKEKEGSSIQEQTYYRRSLSPVGNKKSNDAKNPTQEKQHHIYDQAQSTDCNRKVLLPLALKMKHRGYYYQDNHSYPANGTYDQACDTELAVFLYGPDISFAGVNLNTTLIAKTCFRGILSSTLSAYQIDPLLLLISSWSNYGTKNNFFAT
jgi:hypothetical protein